MRKIIHVDMDAFYASVEELDHPELRGKPIAVGGSPDGRGVVASASYAARKFGIRSAMSCRMAKRLCPHVVFVYPNFTRYQEISDRIHEIFREVTPLVEPLSLDEAYLDVTENALGQPLAREVAAHIKREIHARLGLTASAGVAPNKFLAKVASDMRKPDGLMVIHPTQVDKFLESLPVEKLWGVGPVTAEKLHSFGLRTAGQIRQRSTEELTALLGKFGQFIHDLSRGHDPRPVETSWEPKSRGSEETFEKDLTDLTRLQASLVEQAETVGRSLREMECLARTVTLKLRYSDFKTVTRSQTLFMPTDRDRVLAGTAASLLLEKTDAGERPVRLIGLSASGLLRKDEPQQLWLDFES